jgi:hypothetical protein
VGLALPLELPEARLTAPPSVSGAASPTKWVRPRCKTILMMELKCLYRYAGICDISKVWGFASKVELDSCITAVLNSQYRLPVAILMVAQRRKLLRRQSILKSHGDFFIRISFQVTCVDRQ